MTAKFGSSCSDALKKEEQDLNGLQKWADRNLTEFKVKCEVLHLSWNNSMQQYRIGTDWIASNFAEKDPVSWWTKS